MDIKDLCTQWIAIKEQERATMEWRRDIEDQIARRLKLEDLDKNVTKEMEGYKITASVRKDLKVDVQYVRELAAQHELQSHLGNLFRWDAKVNSRAWKQADPEVIEVLEQAVSEKISRPSFKIEEK